MRDYDLDHGQAYEREPSPRGRPDWPVWVFFAGAFGCLLIPIHSVFCALGTLGYAIAAFGFWRQRDDARDALAQERQASHAFEQTATTLMQRERR